MSSSLFQESQFYRPDRSVHSIGYKWQGSPKMGLAYPIYAEEMMPGDTFDIEVFAKLRAMPMVNPPFAEINVTFDFWFDPYRLAYPSSEKDLITGDVPLDGWMGLITRAADKGQVGGAELADAVELPRWKFDNVTSALPSLANMNSTTTETAAAAYKQYVAWQDANQIWCSLGLPTPFVFADQVWYQQYDPTKNNGESLAHDMIRRSYYRVWNSYYRDENLEDAIDWTLDEPNNKLMPVHQDKNYFTSALPFQQRGTPPALPISGFMPVVSNLTTEGEYPKIGYYSQASNQVQTLPISKQASTTNPPPYSLDLVLGVPQDGYLYTNIESAATFGATDMRFAIQVQKWLEKNARGGIRYHEFLMAHFGVRPADASLGLPEFVGTCRQRVNIQEVLQTSESANTPQGTMAGHGISVDANRVGRYTAAEWGAMIGIMFIKPKTEYLGQGIPRFLTRRTAWDYPFPVFQGLSEQAIYQHEVYYTNDDKEDNDDWRIFGYQGRFDECRHRIGVVHGELRDIKQSWIMNNVYTQAPHLNDAFIQAYNDMRAWAVKTQAPFIADVYINNRAVRPITKHGVPGYVDHY